MDVSPVTAATTTALASSPNPSTYGQPVTFTATVSPSATTSGLPTPTGTVTFMDGSAPIGTGTLDGTGTATFQTSTLTTDPHSITAVYGGDTNYTGSTSTPITQTVNQATPTVSVSDAGGTYNGMPFPATATVAGVDGTPAPSLEGVTPTLSYYDASANLLPGAPTDAGTYSVVATFPGSADYTSASSSPASFTIAQATPMVTVDPVSVTYDGQTHGTTSTVTGVNGISLGAATISYNTSDGNAPVNAGSYVATGSFAGDTDYTSATGTAPIVIDMASTMTTIQSSADPSVYGQPVTFTATVSVVAPGAGTPTGTVLFADGINLLGPPVPLDGTGTASLKLTTLAVGDHPAIAAIYSGDPNFNASTSAALDQQVNQASTTTTVTATPNPSTVGQPVTLTATITPSAAGPLPPTGTVDFFDTTTGTELGSPSVSNGTASVPFAPATAVSDTITATYSGDSNYLGSSGSTTVMVNTPPPPDIAMTSASLLSNSTPVNSNYMITGSNLASPGTIDFYWATGPAISDKIGTTPAATVPTATQVSSTPYTASTSLASLGAEPSSASYILAVADSPSADPAHNAAAVSLQVNVDLAATNFTIAGVLPKYPLPYIHLDEFNATFTVQVPAPVDQGQGAIGSATGNTNTDNGYPTQGRFIEFNPSPGFPFYTNDEPVAFATTQVTVTLFQTSPSSVALGDPPPPDSKMGNLYYGAHNVWINHHNSSDEVLEWYTPGFKTYLLNPLGSPILLRDTGPLEDWVDINASIAPNGAATPFTTIANNAEQLIESTNQTIVFDREIIPYLPLLIIGDPGQTSLLTTDPNGNQTGVTANGTILQNIPGSAYYPSGPIVVIAAPSPGVYQTAVQGLASGTYQLITALTTENQVLAQQSFTGPITAGLTEDYSTTINAQASSLSTTVDLSSSLSAFQLFIDHLQATGAITNTGIANSLNQKLANAEGAIAAGDFNAAKGILGAFLNEVSAQSGQHIGQAAADDLTAYATFLLGFI